MHDSPLPLSAISYSHNPKPMGGGTTFTLREDQLTVSQGPREQEFPLQGISSIRFTYRPRSATNEGYQALIDWQDQTSGRRQQAKLNNLTYKNLVQVERLDQDYRRFMIALVERASRANPSLSLIGGLPQWQHLLTATIGGLATIMLVLFTIDTARNTSFSIGLIFTLITVFFGGWTWRFVSRNRPQIFTADQFPPELLPPSSATRS